MDRIFLQLGPNGALGADSLQWILYRAGKPVSYVRSTKAILARCIREKGIELSAEGKIALDRLADDFAAWKADPGLGGSPVPNSFAPPLSAGENGAGDRSPLRSEVTMIERLGPECSIGTDGTQWIVYRRQPGQGGIVWQDEEWRAVGFISSSKRALISCLEAKGLELSVAGRAALARQNAKIWRWQRAP